MPGTGKTATVRCVVSALQRRAEADEIKSFDFIELNAMKLTEPNQVYPHLLEFLTGKKATARHALTALEAHFSTPSPGRKTSCVDAAVRLS